MKTFLRFLAITLLAASAWAVSAQTTVPTTSQIGRVETTQTSYYSPVNAFYSYSITETIIRRIEMQGGPQNITSLSIYYASATPLVTKTNCTVYLKHVLYSGFLDENNIEDLSDATMVYLGNLNCVQGWNEFEFTTPFSYDGTSNVLLIIDDNSNDWQSGCPFAVDQSHTHTGHDNENTTIAWYSDDLNPDFDNLSSFSGYKIVRTDRGVIRLNGVETPHSLPYCETFENQLGTTAGHVSGWRSDDTNNYFAVTSHGYGGGSTFIHSGYNSDKCMMLTRLSDPVDYTVYSPWFTDPCYADSIRIEFMMSNQYSYVYNGDTSFSKIRLFSQTLSDLLDNGSYAGDLLLRYNYNGYRIGQSCHDGWVPMSVTVPVRGHFSPGEPFRIMFYIRESLADGNTQVLIDDFCVTPVYSSTLVNDLTNVSSNYTVPVNNYFKYSMSHSLVLASELQNQPRILKSIKYYYIGPESMTSKTNCTISLQPTAYFDFNGTTNIGAYWAEPQVVYTGPMNCVPGWNEFVFDEPYYYDGVYNLLVIVEDNSGAYDSQRFSTQRFATTSSIDGSYLSIRRQTDNEADLPFDIEVASRYDFRPVMSFGFAPIVSLPFADNFDSYTDLSYNENWTTTSSGSTNHRWFVNELEYFPEWEGTPYHSSPNNLQARTWYYDVADTTTIVSPWFFVPENSDLNLSFWVANPITRAGNYSHLRVIGENYYGEEFYLGYMTTVGEWRQETVTIPAARMFDYTNYTNVPMRFRLTAVPFQQTDNTSTPVHGLLMDDVVISTSRYTSSNDGTDHFVYTITHDNPYTESFEGVDSPASCGWSEYVGSSNDVHWNVVSRPVQPNSPVQNAYDGSKFLYLYYQTQGHEYRWINSPSMRISGYYPTDSVVVEFMYANPSWDSDVDSCRLYLNYSSINDQSSRFNGFVQPHAEWTKFRYAMPVSAIGSDEFNLNFDGIPHHGFGIFIDKVKVYLQRQVTVAVHAVPANAGSVTPGATVGEGHFVHIEATPNEGYVFKTWVIRMDNSPYTWVLGAPETDYPIDVDQVWTAVFEPAPIHIPVTVEQTETICPQKRLDVYANNSKYGTIVGPPSWRQFQVGSTIELMAIPNEGYVFHHWSDGSTQNPRPYVVSADASGLMAFFFPVTEHPIAVPSSDSIESLSSDWFLVDSYYENDYNGVIWSGPGRYYLLHCSNYGLMAMPRVDAQVSNLRLRANIDCGEYARIEVGVLSDIHDPSTFTPVSTFCPSDEGLNKYFETDIEVDFNSYTGNGHYIAFRLTRVNDASHSAGFWINHFSLTQR